MLSYSSRVHRWILRVLLALVFAGLIAGGTYLAVEIYDVNQYVKERCRDDEARNAKINATIREPMRAYFKQRAMLDDKTALYMGSHGAVLLAIEYGKSSAEADKLANVPLLEEELDCRGG